MVNIFSSPPFYTNHVRLPNANDPVPLEIQQNPKFWPYFKDALGAIEGNHINFSPLHHFTMYTKITKASSPKIAFSHAYFLFSFVMPSLDGKALPLMVKCGMMPLIMILWCQKITTILQMQIILLAISCWFYMHYHLAEWGRANVQYVSFFKQNKK